MKNALILLAGGTGRRLDNAKNTVPKQFIKIGNYNLIEYFLRNLDQKIFNRIHIVVNNAMQKQYLSTLKKDFSKHQIKFVNAGKERQLSSKKGVYSLQKYCPKKVLIHDSARPLTSNKLMKRLLKSLDKYHSCAPFIVNNDFIKYKSKKNIFKHKKIMNIQTPQAFRFKSILKAHRFSKSYFEKDDTSLLEKIGIKTKFIKGEKFNFKITYLDDLDLFKKLKQSEFRSGIGYDIHKINYNSKKRLILCGVKISHPPLIGHSDADVGYHAICDSILGALSLRDIGCYFNNNNKKWENADSKIFMQFCNQQLKRKKFHIVNLDINFICEKPKINKYVKQMKINISTLLKINKNKISIKATTNEKIGFIGKGEGIAAESIIQIVNE
jgi:2-C-methyl-D-erythritol 4-phosphate cytidylyltransferase/2-C-methyl-D-erythritol 2,4-cyclodiphosphate synthase